MDANQNRPKSSECKEELSLSTVKKTVIEQRNKLADNDREGGLLSRAQQKLNTTGTSLQKIKEV